jgi:hypothetical protein
MHIFVDSHSGCHAIGCGQNCLFDMRAEQITHGEDAGYTGLPFIVYAETAYRCGL